MMILVGLAAALPYFRLNYDYDPVDLENDEKNAARQFLPYMKRNIAIGRGDGLRPGK
ncbi:CBN-NLP-46 protein [Caenorhabditis brenneri]|nr:CBN-NLP-46 protein [Caenorhabditis brenneri]